MLTKLQSRLLCHACRLALRPFMQIRAFHLSCLLLLRRCLRPSNCLRFMRLGRAISLEELEEEAVLYSLVNIKQVQHGVRHDGCGTPEHVVHLLF